MAEGFANRYGADVLVARSAGVAPVPRIVAETIAAMREVGIDVARHLPTLYQPAVAAQHDLVINMSGMRLPGRAPGHLIEWAVADPYQRDAETYRMIRNEIEHRVMLLILKLRREAEKTTTQFAPRVSD